MGKFQKQELAALERCYAVRGMNIGGQWRLLYATEGQGSCLQFDGETLQPLEPVWDGPGGTMSLVPVPEKEGEFLAVQNFFPTFQAKEAQIVWGKLEGDRWEIHPFLSLPYVHRFDLLRSATGTWFLGSVLCNSKREKEDWSDPGKVWVGKLPSNWEEPMELQMIYEPLTRNHGYCRLVLDGVERGVVSADEGVFMLTPPQREGESWEVRQLFDQPVSDMAFVDLDGDGCLECLTIEPFHGDCACIYRWTEQGFEKLWTYPHKMEFGHVVWGGEFHHRPTFLLGYRKCDAALVRILWEKGQIVLDTVDQGEGPSNVDVVHLPQGDLILAANRMTGIAAVYQWKEE